jgi:hypothetical protein
MQFVTRAEWGAKPPKWQEQISSKGVFIHYNGGVPLNASVASGDPESVKAHLRGVQDFHMGPSRGWPDIAYSWCVDGRGVIYELRGWGVAGAHTLNWNWSSHAIYLPIGGDQAPTSAQVAGCNQVIAEHNRRFGQGFILGHQQAPNSTSCPGGPTMNLIYAGAFHAANTPPPPPLPIPPGVDPMTNKPIMMQDPTGVFLYYANSPYRVWVRTPEDVHAWRFMGVEYKVITAEQSAFFQKYTQLVKTG